MIPIPEVSNLVREITGFPALCLGFTKEIDKDVDLENHFQSILDLCKSFHPGFAVKSKEIKITGFPALCLGFTKEIDKDVDLENHFQSILDLSRSFHPGFAVKSKEIIKKEMIIKNDGNNVES